MIATVVAYGADAQTPTTPAARIASDIVANMADTPAFNELRNAVCSDDSVRAQLGQEVAGAVNCPGSDAFAGAGNPFSGAGGEAAPKTAPHGFADTSPAIEAAQGVWTTRDRASCSTRYYTWTVAGSIGMSEFKDQSGQMDIEKTIEVRNTSIVTETLSSFHPVDKRVETPGTRWTYIFIDRDHVQVRSAGATFQLTRCGR